ncbi:[FeFe] hydrogenase H-cluster maturation GTPase HydF [Rhizomicrobium palustre]|uniref:[FeFe] hydrogenase H-cluster maturation GTPase HydF n=1 Tax=Rhizomicrobium palustre TaxID=189966 RepID=A0A846MZP7_9PROT|nr:[FeFe] hydrogenase H-cluster maturation GTPase HydF [Rhizomicrobium palustre]NIK88430.1 [FeFe] hydrogenase H-cluster maturation GTPase HydF [Rhizomicrobium palustre]
MDLPVTPKASRLHIGIAGRVNVGKSSFLNMLAGQDLAITSALPGTTTDVVEKTMELLPLGPVTLIDTAGIDDASELGSQRIAMTQKALRRADILALVVTPDAWSAYEDNLINEARAAKVPVLIVINKTDLAEPSADFLSLIDVKRLAWISGSATGGAAESFRQAFKDAVRGLLPTLYTAPPSLLGDLLPPGGLAVLVVPIDLGAPAGRLIVPQVQALRDLLDSDASALVVKDREYAATLSRLKTPPDLVVCDSQVVARVVADTPQGIPLTTFSILFARFKGDLNALARGAGVLNRLKPGDRILIAEGCSHHPLEDDIGRVKIPRWLRQFSGCELDISTCAGHDFPADLKDYRLIIHCGGCVMTRHEVLARMGEAETVQTEMTNYGLAISVLQGVLERALSPFPGALAAYKGHFGT